MTTPDLAARAAATGRETRQFTVQNIELRAAGEGNTLTLDGFACVTDSAYRMSDWLGEYDEVVRSGAFGKTLKEKADVRLLLNHDGLPLARTKSGTLRLDEVTSGATTGLHVTADLEPRSGLVNDVRLAMERGDLDEMSFAFQVVKQEWSPDYTQRDIQEVRLYDVSVVTYPANPATSASLRGLDFERIPEDEARTALERLQRRFSTNPQGGIPLSLARAQRDALDLQ